MPTWAWPPPRALAAPSRDLVQLRGVEVPVIGVEVDQPVGVGLGSIVCGRDVVGAGDAVPEMAVDGVDEEEFAVLVPIVAPRVGGARAEDLDDFALRMVAPECAAQRNAVGGGRAGRAEFAGSRGAAAAVEPTVGTEAEAVGEVVVVFRRHR
jgi:hypothetical protein